MRKAAGSADHSQISLWEGEWFQVFSVCGHNVAFPKAPGFTIRCTFTHQGEQHDFLIYNNNNIVLTRQSGSVRTGPPFPVTPGAVRPPETNEQTQRETPNQNTANSNTCFMLVCALEFGGTGTLINVLLVSEHSHQGNHVITNYTR